MGRTAEGGGIGLHRLKYDFAPLEKMIGRSPQSRATRPELVIFFLSRPTSLPATAREQEWQRRAAMLMT